MTTPTFTIRRATSADLDVVADLEALCFPPTEAAGREAYAARLAAFANRYWLLLVNDTLVSLVGGLTTNTPDLTDEMYADASLHDPAGRFQMIFSVATHPNHRGKGYASALLRAAAEACRSEGRAALVLTCKPARIPFYARNGYTDEGPSDSTHGGVLWHQMRLVLQD